MPILTNPKHERFAQELAKGKTGDEAYVLAGYKRNKDNASRLKASEGILARVSELLTPSATKAQITIESLTQMYLEDRRLAQEANQLSVSKGAADSLAKLYGLLIDRAENGKPGDFARLTEDELDRFIAQREGRASGGVPRARVAPGARAPVPSGRPN